MKETVAAPGGRRKNLPAARARVMLGSRVHAAMSDRTKATQRPPSVVVASEVIPPPDLGGRTAMALAMAHQERASRVAEDHGGAVRVRVGQGCVLEFEEAEAALLAVTALLSPAGKPGAGRPSRVRAAVHRAPLRDAETALADPAVAFTRRLLEHAGPGEIVLSVDLHEHLSGQGLQTTPIPSREDTGGAGSLPAAHRLLSRPVPSARPTSPHLSGWQLGGAVALAIAAVVTTLVLTLTAA